TRHQHGPRDRFALPFRTARTNPTPTLRPSRERRATRTDSRESARLAERLLRALHSHLETSSFADSAKILHEVHRPSNSLSSCQPARHITIPLPWAAGKYLLLFLTTMR